jgi:hypothetical protein
MAVRLELANVLARSLGSAADAATVKITGGPRNPAKP